MKKVDIEFDPELARMALYAGTGKIKTKKNRWEVTNINFNDEDYPDFPISGIIPVLEEDGLRFHWDRRGRLGVTELSSNYDLIIEAEL